MTGTDYWPQEENAIWRTLIVPMYPDGTVLECSCVKFGTTTVGRLSCAQSTVLGDAIGVALKYATVGAPERIPVMLHGIIKMTTSGSTHAVEAGLGVMNSITTTVHCVHDVGTWGVAESAFFAGASHVLGIAMHDSPQDLTVGAGSEVLIHVGHSF